jgi:RNA recognition motif 2
MTTLMIRRVPRKYCDGDLSSALNASLNIFSKAEDCYDLLYLPLDIDRGCNRGYAFVNFTTHALAKSFFELFQVVNRSSVPAALRACDVVYARIQGKEATIDNILKKRGDGLTLPFNGDF